MGRSLFGLFECFIRIDEMMRLEKRDLERFDVSFDLPDHLTPEFPPPIYLTCRPDLGDVSRGKVLSIKNYYMIMKGILTPVQMEDLRLLLTLEDTVEFFNLVLGTKLTEQEKKCLVAFMHAL